MPPTDIAIVSLEWDMIDLIESIGGYTIRGFFDPRPDGATPEFPHLGPDSAFTDVKGRYPGLAVALTLDNPEARARLFDFYGDAVVGLRSADAYVSPRAVLGHGCLVQRGVTVMPNARVGRACKLNVNATINHDVTLGDFCTLAPGAQLLGQVRVGTGVYIGAGAIVRQRCTIGEGAFIGAGAVVVRDVPAQATVVGVPASRRLK